MNWEVVQVIGRGLFKTNLPECSWWVSVSLNKDSVNKLVGLSALCHV